ncbi:hypothetical protein CON65_04370 [Bacillus pseudomycoides]|uniref:Uncharacterized protein n=1 Tax=Bacillus pseudomycoides TaxID=64104 RepID=A0AA91VEH4_9BACI|nr:hypothetical protein CON65_04370 [Bacillus pseudomycoides]PEU14723.1 hypothetical protein CN524_08525 [Bacillus sp. AFS019443]PEU19524.1 hypothetical protein CN525_07245 [Bacillus sp. AFS014408]PFW64394.1 hypothetical protein COL20_04465 [Bacillus sp. AFS075034]
MKFPSIGLLQTVHLPLNFFRKAEAACSESQDAHAKGRETLFASSEGAKRPEILAARAGQCFRQILRWKYY